MGFAVGMTALSVASGLGQMYVSNQASKAAETRQKYEADLLDRQAKDERHTLAENNRRRMDDRSRYLARVALQQAASGLRTDQGTPLAVLGEVTSRLDEEIYDATEGALARVGQLQNSAAMTRWGAKQTADARGVSMFGSLLKTAASGYATWDNARYNSAP